MKVNKNNKIVYFVEGENEKVMVDNIKNTYLVSGSVSVKNVLQEDIKMSKLRTFPKNTNIVLVFDTDVEEPSKIEKLKDNIKILKKSKNIKEIIIIPQVKNFQDELIRSTSIKNLIEFTNSKTKSEFKGDFNKMSKNLISKLEKFNFDITKFWSYKLEDIYREFENMSCCIKI